MVARAVLLIGVSGVGKSTMAQAVGSLWSGRGNPTAVVDTDWLAQFGPKPPRSNTDPLSFHDRLRADNLAHVSRTFRNAGAEFIVTSGSPSSRLVADELVSAIGAPTTIVELRANAGVVAARRTSRNREPSDHPESHGTAPLVSEADVARDADHLASLELADLAIRNHGPIGDVAAQVVDALGWS